MAQKDYCNDMELMSGDCFQRKGSNDDWSILFVTSTFLLGIPVMMFVVFKVLGKRIVGNFLSPESRHVSYSTKLPTDGKSEESLDCHMDGLFSEVSIDDKLKLMDLMREDLDKIPANVKLMSITRWGDRRHFDQLSSKQHVESYGRYWGFEEDALEKVTSDVVLSLRSNESSDSCVSCFIRTMIQHIMSEEYLDENGWEYTVKSSLDAIIIQSFVDHANLRYNGLTKDQMDQVNATVIRQFNMNVQDYHEGFDHMELLLEREAY